MRAKDGGRRAVDDRAACIEGTLLADHDQAAAAPPDRARRRSPERAGARFTVRPRWPLFGCGEFKGRATGTRHVSPTGITLLTQKRASKPSLTVRDSRRADDGRDGSARELIPPAP